MHLKEGYHLHNGKYHLLNVIGEGGFSLTYKGLWNTEIQGPLGKLSTQVPVCVKEYFFKDYCLRNETTNFIETNSLNGKLIFNKYKEKIIKEARILSEIHHPNVVKVLEVFKQNNTVYIIMEFLSGYSLKQELEQTGAFSEEKVIGILYKIGQALQYIHDKNILHLDIKPSNILINSQNPILIDFGISKRYDMLDQQETSTAILAASKGYASIEQYDSESMQIFSPCPDIYSLGATMYCLLTGQVPTESIFRSTKGLQSPRELNPKISENTENVILKAMDLNASERYQTVLEMISALGYNPEKDKVASFHSERDEERTELLSAINEQVPLDVDNEQTLVQSPLPSRRRKLVRKKSYNKLYYTLIVVLLCGAFFIILEHENSKKIAGETQDIVVDPNEFRYSRHFEAGKNQFLKNNLSQAKEEIQKALEYKKTPEASIYLAKIDSMILLLQKPKEEVISPTVHETNTDQDEVQKSYNQYRNQAIADLNNKNFKIAKENFQKAGNLKHSTEITDYIKQCDSELEKRIIAKRLQLYDIWMKFGNFVVVKNKTTGLVGAIDEKGIEKIPCKYSSTESSGPNRVFVRQDDLFDIYSPQGTLIQPAASDY